MNQTIFFMCYFSAERFCIGHCSVFLDNSKRLKVNSGILDGYTGILNLESQIDLLKRRWYTAFCLSYTQNLPHNIIANSVCKIKLGFYSIVFNLLSIQFFFSLLIQHSDRNWCMAAYCVFVLVTAIHTCLSLSLSTQPALDYKANWLRPARPHPPPPPILTMCSATADQNGRLVSQ
jgi:hypothetical protein